MKNAQLLNAALPKLTQALREAGLTQELTSYHGTSLSLEEYLQSPLALGFDLLCLEQQGRWGVLIALHDLKDARTLEAQVAAALSGPAQVALIDRN